VTRRDQLKSIDFIHGSLNSEWVPSDNILKNN